MAPEPNDRQLPLEDYRPYLLLLARLNVGHRLQGKVDPSDLVQETMLKAHGHREQFRGHTEAERRAYLRRILGNALADAGRRLGHEPDLQQVLETSSARLESWLAEQSTPSQHAQHAERLIHLADALGRL